MNKIIQNKKSQEELIKEQEAYEKAMEELLEGEILPQEPLDYKIVAASFSNIEINMHARAETDENIKDKEEFIAKKITLYR